MNPVIRFAFSIWLQGGGSPEFGGWLSRHQWGGSGSTYHSAWDPEGAPYMLAPTSNSTSSMLVCLFQEVRFAADSALQPENTWINEFSYLSPNLWQIGTLRQCLSVRKAKWRCPTPRPFECVQTIVCSQRERVVLLVTALRAAWAWIWF